MKTNGGLQIILVIKHLPFCWLAAGHWEDKSHRVSGGIKQPNVVLKSLHVQGFPTCLPIPIHLVLMHAKLTSPDLEQALLTMLTLWLTSHAAQELMAAPSSG